MIEPFGIEATDAETAELNARLEAALAGAPSILTQPAAEVRAARERGESLWGPVVTVPEARTTAVSHLGHSVPVRVIAPQGTPRGIYLHLHGGGWTLGAAHHSDVRNRQISRLGLCAVSVEYRLAPEHPYPAGPDDCEVVADWLLEGGADEISPGGAALPLLIGGESAGAHLSLVTLLRLRDRRGSAGFAAANLVYGCYDLRLTPSAARWGDRNLVLSTPILHWFVDHFLQGKTTDDPDVSPLRADLRELPPALLTVGTLDPLLDDSLFLHARWRAAGNASELAVYPGGIHTFNVLPLALGRTANARIDRFLAEHVSA